MFFFFTKGLFANVSIILLPFFFHPVETCLQWNIFIHTQTSRVSAVLGGTLSYLQSQFASELGTKNTHSVEEPCQ